jgi:D-alanine transaminase
LNDLCYLNGQIVPLSEARVDPQDRGFLFGDSLYEVVKVVSGAALHLEPHLRRLAAGLERIEIPYPEDLADCCDRLLFECSLDTGYLYLQVTRGAAPRSHLPPDNVSPTVVVIPYVYTFPGPAKQGMKAISVPDWRWEFRNLKTTSLIATVVGKLHAREAQVDEVLFRGADGELREGGSTNLFVLHKGVLETHPADGSILVGVTRGLLLDLAKPRELAISENPPLLGEIDHWQEAFLCGTLTGVQPLVELDGSPIGGGETGPVTTRLALALDRFESDLVAQG